jgi:Flp pilus assembly protein TadB
MTLVVGCALLAAAGFGLLIRGLVPSRPPLAVELERLLAAPGSPPRQDWWADGWGASVWARLAPFGDRFPGVNRDLAVMGAAGGRLMAQSVAMSAAGAGLVVAMLAVLAAGGLAAPVGLAGWAVALGALAGLVTPRAVLHSQAEERRSEMRATVAVVCDLAAVAVAAGDGLESALAAALAPGSGWAFERLRRQVAAAGGRREPPWTALDRLGLAVEVAELVELAQTLALGGVQGARVRDALAAQSRSLRERAASDIEAKAGSVTERMSFPLVLLLAGFALVIGYPAVSRL